MQVYRTVAAGIAALSIAAAGTAQAEYPDRPIRYVLHVSPGGATDVMARELSNGLQQVLGQSVIIENKPGGRGASQLAELKAAKPDGYTIGSVTNTHIGEFNQVLKQYNVDSLDWIVKLVQEPYLVVVRADSPIKNLKDLTESIRANPGKTVIAGFVRGSGVHFAWEMLMQAAGLPSKSVNWVPYDSVGDSVTALLGAHGSVSLAYVDLVKDHVAAGNLRVIGVMTDKRLAEMPDVPTFKEQGFNVDTGWQQWRGIIGPRGMPDDVKKKIADAVEEVMKSERLQRYMKQGNLVYDFMGPAAFTEYAHEQDEVTKKWVKELNLTR